MPEFKKSIFIIGGGLSGVAAAYWAKRQDPAAVVSLLEKETSLLHWTRRRGLGEVVLGNIRHPGADPEPDLPGGGPEAASMLEKWPAQATLDWLRSLGMDLPVDPEGGFSVDAGPGLAELFRKTLESLGIEQEFGYPMEAFSRQPDGTFRIWSKEGNARACDRLVLATGGERNHGMALVRELGMACADVVPAYVRLKAASPRLGQALGPLTREVSLRCPRTGAREAGSATLSARGLEGTVVSRMSARFVRDWSQRRYRLPLEVDWMPHAPGPVLRGELQSRCRSGKRKPVGSEPLFGLEPRQWQAFLEMSRIDPETPWARMKARKLETLVHRIKSQTISFSGMGLPQGERAWAGGIALEEIEGSRGMCRKLPGLYLAGEMLDFLGAPGGAHLNLVWSSGYLAGSGACLDL